MDYPAVQSKRSNIGQMSSADYHRILGEPIEREVAMPIEELKPTKQISLEDFPKRKR